MAEENQAASQEDNAPQLRAEKIFIKDVSFETPNSPSIFTEEWKPSLTFDMGQQVSKVSDDMFEVVLVITATTVVGDKTAYLAEVHQAGLFSLQWSDQRQLDRMLGVICPRMLYPYACSAASDLVTRGGFPQLILAPLNFDALYQQRLEEVKENNDSAEAPESSTSSS